MNEDWWGIYLNLNHMYEPNSVVIEYKSYHGTLYCHENHIQVQT